MLGPSVAAVARNSSRDDATAVHDKIPDQRIRHACSSRRLNGRGSPRALTIASRLRNLHVSSDHLPGERSESQAAGVSHDSPRAHTCTFASSLSRTDNSPTVGEEGEDEEDDEE